MKSKFLSFALAFLFLAGGASALPAATIDWVTVGSPGNAANSANGFGAVAYTYQIGKYEITNAQYAEFLNAVAVDDTYSIYSTNADITRGGAVGARTYTVVSGRENFPVSSVGMAGVMRFSNWLHNGQPIGPQGATTTERGSYTLDGARTISALQAVVRSPQATVVVPTTDEWYKAAAYDPTTGSYYLYATGSNNAPSNIKDPSGTNNVNFGYGASNSNKTNVGFFAGSPSPWGTFDQSGNISEITSDPVTSPVSGWYLYGGYFNNSITRPQDTQATAVTLGNNTGNVSSGFRVAQLAPVPEPSAIVLLALGGIGATSLRRRRR